MNLHMIHHWKALDLDITDFKYLHDLTSSRKIIPSQTSNLKQEEIIKVSDEPTSDTSLESS